MRRVLLTLTILSGAVWSQPAQQQAQLPPVVKVEMPPERIRTTLLKLAIPTILGASAALLGVWLTNRHNQQLNTANQRYESDEWQHQWQLQLKKDFHFTVIRTAYELKAHHIRLAALVTVPQEKRPPDFAEQVTVHKKDVEELKLALSAAISVGWILLPKEHFAQLQGLDSLALSMMAAISMPKYDAFQKKLETIVELAKRDLGYTDVEG